VQRRIADVSALIGHRGAYRLVDEVVSHEPEKEIVCAKEIGGDEPYFAGHFPGHPIVPGVLEIEMMFQAARLHLMLEEEQTDQTDVTLAGIESARFHNPIVPPAHLTITVEARGREGTRVRFSGLVADASRPYARASFCVECAEL
jgi:3-hydroxyacyl-[acyl-carrier-protein] dehydratase